MEDILFDFVQEIIALDTTEGFIKEYQKNLNVVGDKTLAYELAEKRHEKWFKGKRMYNDRSTFHVVLSRYNSSRIMRAELAFLNVKRQIAGLSKLSDIGCS